MRTVYYTQDAKHYRSAVKHMLRFYFQIQGATIDQMSPATQKAWVSCHRVLSELTQDEFDQVKAFFIRPFQRGVPDTVVPPPAVAKVVRLVAIERGLADDR